MVLCQPFLAELEFWNVGFEEREKQENLEKTFLRRRDLNMGLNGGLPAEVSAMTLAPQALLPKCSRNSNCISSLSLLSDSILEA